MNNQLFTRFFSEVERVFVPLTQASDYEDTFQSLGWNLRALTGNNTASFFSAVNTLKQSIQTVAVLVATPPQTFTEFKAALQQIAGVQQAVQALSTAGFTNTTVAAALPGKLVEKLLVIYLRIYQPVLFELLRLLQIVHTEEGTDIVDASNKLLYEVGIVPTITLSRLKEFLSDPAAYLKSCYWPAGLPDQAAASTAADTLFPVLGALAYQLGIDFRSGQPNTPQPPYLTAQEWEELRSVATVGTSVLSNGQGALSLLVGLGLLPATAYPNEGAGIFFVPQGTATIQERVGDWLLSADLSALAGGVRIHENTIASLGSSAAALLGHVTVQPILNSSEPSVWGSSTGTRLEIGPYTVQCFFTATSNDGDYGVQLAVHHMRFVLASADADSFLAKMLQKASSDPSIDFSLVVGWSKKKGFHLSGHATANGKLEAQIVLPKLGSKGAGIAFSQLALGLQAADSNIEVYATTNATVQLGPVTAAISQFGLEALLVIGKTGNFGPLNLEIGFKGPSGVGIVVDSDLITGGGYLFFDAANHRYAGAATLTLKTAARDINLNALGILQTQLPSKPDEYSLLLLITAQFSPIQLGLGFTLNGLGGLVGVNRAADTDYLRGLVRQGDLKRLLFPVNVLEDPAGTLALVDAAFPSTEGRYIIGLLGELGWGTPNLITLDVALLLEFPAPFKVLLLGVLQVILPDENANTLKLRADFLGFVDFGAKKASFDASLSNSHILSFTLTGEMAFRLYQGANPLFVITAGGFHPAFQPPAGAALTGLRRLTLTLSKSDSLQLTLISYFAVTSNTVQFGSHLDLYLRICRGLTVEGHFGFDVLFQFQPFQVLAHVEADVAVKSGSHELLSVHLSLDVTGPGPWHVWGEASFRLLCIKISFDVNATIGDPAAAPAALPAPNVHEQLVAALKDPASWAVEASKTIARSSGVTLRPANAAAGELFIDPRGTLVVRQRIAPLGVQLEKYGSSNVAPIGGQRFDLVGIILGDNDLHDGSEAEATKEFFAPDQYRVLTDGQKLSLPSFQSLVNGVRLKRLTGLKAAAKATRRIVEYEQKQLNGPSSKVRPKTDIFQKLAQGGTLGQAVRAEQPSARVPKPVGWTEDTYEVVNAADLNYYNTSYQQFGSQVEAEQYRQTLAVAAELLVVPSYQMLLA